MWNKLLLNGQINLSFLHTFSKPNIYEKYKKKYLHLMKKLKIVKMK